MPIMFDGPDYLVRMHLGKPTPFPYPQYAGPSQLDQGVFFFQINDSP